MTSILYLQEKSRGKGKVFGKRDQVSFRNLWRELVNKTCLAMLNFMENSSREFKDNVCSLLQLKKRCLLF